MDQAIVDHLTDFQADSHRCHDPMALHWLVTLGFEKLLACFSNSAPSSPLTTATVVPPKERVDLGVAKLHWESYMSGKVTLKEIMETLGTRKVSFVAPERMETVTTIMAKLQRELMEMHQHTIHNPDQPDVSE